MTDANPKPGWYAVFHKSRLVHCIERTDRGWFVHDGFVEDWPYNTWTLGPRIEDLLRDAARYRWLLKQTAISGTELYDLYAACNWEPAEGQIDALIDAEIAREAGEAKP